MPETKASEQRGATTNNAVLVAAIKVQRILDDLDEETRARVVGVLNAIATSEELVIKYPGKQLELAG